MGKKYLDTKEGSLEQSILGLWQDAAKNIDETNKNDKSDDGEGMDAVQPKAVKKKFKDRKDKDIDNDGDVDSTDKYLHKRRKAISKAIKKEKKEEVELDEKNKITSKEIDFDLFSDEKGAKAANKTMNREIRKASQMKDYKTARKYMDKIQKKYSELGAEDTEPESIISSILGQVFKEEVQIDEMFGISSNSNHRAKTMKMLDGMGIKYKKDGRNGLIILGVAPKDQKGILDKIHKDIGMTTYRIMDEKVQVKEGKMSQLHQLMKDGKTAEEIAKIMRVDAKTIKKLMAGHMKDMEESYEIGTDEYRKHTEDVTPGQDGEWVDAVNKKNESMREALAKVWGVSESKSPFKKEDKKDLTKELKDGKTMTGKKIAKVDIDPTIKEKAK